MNSLLPASNSSTVSTVAADSGEHPLVDEVLRQGKERKKERVVLVLLFGGGSIAVKAVDDRIVQCA